MSLHISLISVFPELYGPFLETSLIRRAQHQKAVSISTTSLFSFVPPKHRIDAPSYGHGAGMLIRPDVVEKAIEEREAIAGRSLRIFFSPQGKKIDQFLLKNLAKKIQEIRHVILVAPRYEGVDSRAEKILADELLSVGDFVLMGGDLPALIFLEGILRFIPGVVGRKESVEQDSFSGPFVDYPQFTEPLTWHGITVPEILRSGNHEKINAWRLQEAANNSIKHHFQWARSIPMNKQERRAAQVSLPHHYIALLHADVLLGEEKQVGTTSVTSLDIHDIARSSKTYGIQQFFIVTPLKDQQKVVQKFLDFWRTDEGVEYNKNRHDALSIVDLSATLDEVIASIQQKEGKSPLLIATSAGSHEHQKMITFFDQEQIWSQDRPVLFLFGTGKGLSEQLIARCDYLLIPLEGFGDFNHLSVRSAAAIILDRWLGLNVKVIP